MPALPLLSWFQRIEIVDDDRVGDGDSPLWFGAAHEELSCPAGTGRFDLSEPAGGGVTAFQIDLVIAERLEATRSGDESPACAIGAGKSVTEYRYELRSGSALVGADVLLPGEGVVRFVAGRGDVSVSIAGDGAFEPLEEFALVLLGGTGPVASFTVVVHDIDSALEQGSAATAAAVRAGRLLASEVSDVLADRFSCAASAASARTGIDPAPLWPGGASGPSPGRRVRPSALLGRLALMAGAAAGPRTGAAGALSEAAAPGYAAGPRSVFPSGRLDAVGRILDGMRYQGDPGRWMSGLGIPERGNEFDR